MEQSMELPSIEKTLEQASLLATMNERRRSAAMVFDQSLIFGYQGGLFKADAMTCGFAKMLTEHEAYVVMIDLNKNPIMIQDPDAFLTELMAVYTEAAMRYYAEVDQINKTRSKEGLTNV